MEGSRALRIGGAAVSSSLPRTVGGRGLAVGTGLVVARRMSAAADRPATGSRPVKPPTVLITGVGGLIGSRLARELSASHAVVGLDNDPVPPELGALLSGFLECDLTDDAAVRQALQTLRDRHGGELASVVHLAAYYDFSGEPSPLYEELTVRGTERLLDGLADFRVEQFVFSSTILVMQPSADGSPLDEGSPVAAEWDYPQSKIDTEATIERHRRGIPTVILRIAGVYDDDGHSIPIVQQIRRIYEKRLESYLFPGNADHAQPFVHLDDLVDCIHRVVDARRDLDPQEVFLIGETDLMSYRDLQERIGLMLHGEEWPALRIPAVVAKAGAWIQDKLPFAEDPFIKPWMVDLADANYPIRIDRARRKLGWEPAHSLRHTLDRICNRLLEDPAGWYEANGLPVPEASAAAPATEAPRSPPTR